MTENEKKEEKGTKIERSSEKKKLESIVEGLRDCKIVCVRMNDSLNLFL